MQRLMVRPRQAGCSVATDRSAAASLSSSTVYHRASCLIQHFRIALCNIMQFASKSHELHKLLPQWRKKENVKLFPSQRWKQSVSYFQKQMGRLDLLFFKKNSIKTRFHVGTVGCGNSSDVFTLLQVHLSTHVGDMIFTSFFPPSFPRKDLLHCITQMLVSEVKHAADRRITQV